MKRDYRVRPIGNRTSLVIACIVVALLVSVSSVLYYVAFPINAEIGYHYQLGDFKQQLIFIFSGNVFNHGLSSHNVALNITFTFNDGVHPDKTIGGLYGLDPIDAGSSVYFYQQEIAYGFGVDISTFNYDIVLLW